jgi:hypothetical protein
VNRHDLELWSDWSLLGSHQGLYGTKARDATQEEKQSESSQPPLANETSADDDSHHQEITNYAFADGEIGFDLHGFCFFVSTKITDEKRGSDDKCQAGG